jgi:hypothetical protein
MAQTKQQKERLLLVALVLVAIFVWYFYFGKGPASTGSNTGIGSYQPIDAQDYSVIFKDLGDSQSTVYKSSGRNIFVAGPTPVQQAAAVAKTAAPPRPPIGPMKPPEPPPPVLSMKFFGYGSLPVNGPKRAFLQDGEEIHIVQEGDTLQNHIRITHIGNDKIEYEDTLTGKKNSNNLELPQQAAAPQA